jgi:adenine/guanine phosphoribosyltransferase-like PRPP-binding protein
VSGQCVGFPLALRLKVPIAVLRKQGEDCHALQGTLINRQAVTGKRVLFVDDFIATGETRDRCREAVATAGGELVGSFTYRRGKFSLDPEIKYDDVNHAPF